MLDLLFDMVRLSLMPYDDVSLTLVEAVAVEFIGMGPRFDATLKLSMPVICILRVLGLPAIRT